MNTNTLPNTVQLLDAKPLRVAAIGLLLALLSACGSEVTTRSSSGLFSGGGPTPAALLGTGGTGEAQCAGFDSTTTRLAGRVTTYYNNGVLQEDRVRVRITSIADAFATNSNYYIQAFRWKIGASGATELDATPVQFNFEKGAGAAAAMTADVSSVSLTSIAAYRTANSIAGTTPIDFFANTTMVVKGVDYNWQALKIVIYDGSTSPATVVGQSDFLLPVFQANPNAYAASHSAILAALHPFYSQRATVLSEADWATRSTSYCF
ncbi:hypothetical protein BH10BDE1_BH10BDE1_23940 [soil metagenome]